MVVRGVGLAQSLGHDAVRVAKWAATKQEAWKKRKKEKQLEKERLKKIRLAQNQKNKNTG